MRAVITFHAIDDRPGPLSYPPRALATLLTALAEADLPVLTLDALLSAEAPRGVALTFDDGMASVAEAALPILRDHRVPAHLFLTTGAVGGDNRWPGQPQGAAYQQMLDWTQVEALHDGGVFIEGHTAHHPDLRTLDEQRIAAECDAADGLIERRLGRRPRHFAYPYGFYDDHVRAAVRRLYASAATTEFRDLSGPFPLDAVPRLDSHYLRSPWLMRNLSGRPAGLYLELRRLIRRLRNKS